MDSFLRGKSGDGDVEAMRERRQPKTYESEEAKALLCRLLCVL